MVGFGFGYSKGRKHLQNVHVVLKLCNLILV